MIKKIFALTCIAGFFLVAGIIEHNYSMDGVVVNETTIRDITGNEWEMDYIPYRNGSTVKIHFNDNCTTNRKDDIIKNISLTK